MLADVRQINEPVDQAQQVIRRDMILKAKAVEQRFLHYRPLAHHRLISRFSRSIESEHQHNFKRELFNTIRPFLTSSLTHAILRAAAFSSGKRRPAECTGGPISRRRLSARGPCRKGAA